MSCSKEQLKLFLSNELEIDDRLNFLFHLEECPNCWEVVYGAVKAEHPHYYKTNTRRSRISRDELEKLSREVVLA